MDNRSLISALIILFSINSVFALGINAPYWNSNPLKMYPGETKYSEFYLVNSVTEPDARAIVELIESEGIAEISGPREFSVPSGSNDRKIILKISVPAEASVGKTYNIKFSVRSGEEQQQGTVQLSVGYDVEFPVLIVNKSETSGPGNKNTYPAIIITLISLVLIILLIYFIYKAHKKHVLNN